jgi:hypothetical protein
MKTKSLLLMALCMSLMVQPFQLAASSNFKSVVINAPLPAASTDVLVERVDAIDNMDKTQLKPSEKRELRKELRSIKHQLQASEGGGIYISVGAVILILILLIILL